MSSFTVRTRLNAFYPSQVRSLSVFFQSSLHVSMSSFNRLKTSFFHTSKDTNILSIVKTSTRFLSIMNTSNCHDTSAFNYSLEHSVFTRSEHICTYVNIWPIQSLCTCALYSLIVHVSCTVSLYMCPVQSQCTSALYSLNVHVMTYIQGLLEGWLPIGTRLQGVN